MSKKFWLIFSLIIVIILAALILWPSRPGSKQPGASSSSDNIGLASGTRMTVSGWLRCLSHKNANNVLCVIGVENAAGQDYALLNADGSPIDPTTVTTGSAYTAIGMLTTGVDKTFQDYNIQGVIELSQ